MDWSAHRARCAPPDRAVGWWEAICYRPKSGRSRVGVLSIVAEHNIDEIKLRRICSKCVGEPYLKREIDRIGEKALCYYCNNSWNTESINDLASRIETTFEQHFQITSDQPDSLEWSMMREGGYDWDRAGEPALDAIAQAAVLEQEPAEDIRLVLEDRHDDFERAAMGEEGPFDKSTHYEEAKVNDAEFRADWAAFERSLKSETRFFSRSAEAILATIFDGVFDAQTRSGNPIVVEAGLGSSLAALYRARVFQSQESFESALARPDREIGPPPSSFASAGRMNARGVSVFYGATEEAIALAEVRPPVGSRVVVGRFDFLRRVRLLDIAAMRSVFVSGSIFEPGYARRLERAKFLETLSWRVTMPVMPNDEPFEYLVTQAMADYLADRDEHGLDGLIYPSVQGGGKGANVVLFNKASRVETLETPAGMNVSVFQHSGDPDEEGNSNYTVWEEVPQAAEERQGKVLWKPAFPSISHSFPADSDHRETTLRIDLSSLRVHCIRAVSITSDTLGVERHRRQAQATPDF